MYPYQNHAVLLLTFFSGKYANNIGPQTSFPVPQGMRSTFCISGSANMRRNSELSWQKLACHRTLG
jgi:hypothetical protein